MFMKYEKSIVYLWIFLKAHFYECIHEVSHIRKAAQSLVKL